MTRAPRYNKTGALSEGDEQIRFINWVRIAEHQYPDLRRMFSVPNGGFRGKVTAVRMAQEGTRRGVPDLICPVARGGYHGLAIEMKATKGGRVSPEQRDWIDALTGLGWHATVAKGCDEAREIAVEYLSKPRTEVKR